MTVRYRDFCSVGGEPREVVGYSDIEKCRTNSHGAADCSGVVSQVSQDGSKLSYGLLLMLTPASLVNPPGSCRVHECSSGADAPKLAQFAGC